jgi:hypothetical protein
MNEAIPTLMTMMRQRRPKAVPAIIFAALFPVSAAWAGDQAKTILNALDPKSMNELFAALPKQPDAALTNISPISPNKFRFLFIWPASNGFMTYERVGRSFAERFASFAGQLKPLAVGFCLTSRSMYYGSAAYGDEEVNIAYRDIEVRYSVGWQAPCAGRYFTASEIEQLAFPPPPYGSYGAALPRLPGTSPKKPALPPEESLKPFLNTPAIKQPGQ